MNVPNWWEAILLTLAAWRTFQLLSADDILDVPRRFIVDKLNETWQDFVDCVYCFGFWIAVAWWVAWEIWPHGTLVVAVPLAIASGVIALAKVLSFDE